MKKMLILAVLTVIFSCSSDENDKLQASDSQESISLDKFYLDGKLQPSVKFEEADPNSYEIVIHGDKRVDAFSSKDELAKASYLDKRIYTDFLIANSAPNAYPSNDGYKTITELEDLAFDNKSSISIKSDNDPDPHGIFDDALDIPNHSDELVFHYVRDDHSWISIPLKTTTTTRLDAYAVYDALGRKNFYNIVTGYLFEREFTIKNHSDTSKYLWLRSKHDDAWHFYYFFKNEEKSTTSHYEVSQIHVFSY